MTKNTRRIRRNANFAAPKIVLPPLDKSIPKKPPFRTLQMQIAEIASRGDYVELDKALDALIEYGQRTKPGGDWETKTKIFQAWVRNPQGELPYQIFMLVGNIKLPFVTFSTLPIATCPGAGECMQWCYSFNSWRNCHPFFRQIMNTILLVNRDKRIKQAWNNIPKDVDVRLYVDGDFDSRATVRYWFDLCEKRPDLKVYGYSKSWAEIAGLRRFPSNYVLNLSSGSIHESNTRLMQRMESLPICRDWFKAVHLELPKEEQKRLKALKQGKYTDPVYKQAVREAAAKLGIDKFFICPGQCGSCTKKQHACGSHRFDDIPVLILIH